MGVNLVGTAATPRKDTAIFNGHIINDCLILLQVLPMPARVDQRWGCFLSTAQAEEIEAVSSRVSADYVRAKLPMAPTETYAFAKGGYPSSGTQDYSIDKIQFLDAARTIAGPLATQRYIPTKDPKTTRLLVMVYWGATASLTEQYEN